MNGMYAEKTDQLKLYRWKIFESWTDHMDAVLTTRIGGVSTAHLRSLNLGHRVDDTPDRVEANRRAVSRALNCPDGYWTLCNQVHGTRIAAISGAGERPFSDCDGIVVNAKKTIAGILLADCHPVVVYDPVRNIGGIAHAGWKGTVAGIAGRIVEKIVRSGSRPEDLFAATGPGIGPCCYEVRDDVAKVFYKKFDGSEGTTEILTKVEGTSSWDLNLEEANYRLLRRTGIPEAHIGRGGFCTACRREEFYSHRKESGITGRQAVLMILR